MSRPDPTWYGNVIRSYVAWLIAGALALAAAWPMWHQSQTDSGLVGFGAFVWSFIVLLVVGIVAGVVLNRVLALPCASGLVTLGSLGLASLAILVDDRLAWTVFVLSPGVGAAVAAIPAASSPTVERICVAVYAALLLLVVAGLTWG
ncbi:MAG TPA: hypothetical protein VIP77_15890 [Jiangellaceae bacterium]